MMTGDLKVQLRGNPGHTLAEVVVAMALLLTVLVPVAGIMAFAAERQMGAETTRAIVLAHTAMEEALHGSEAETVETVTGRWTVRTMTEEVNGTVRFRVDVFRKHPDRPAASLWTARLADDEESR